MKKFISSSISKDLRNSVEIAKSLNLGIEISRLPNFIDIDNNLDGIIRELQNALNDFEGARTLHGMFFDLSIASQDRAIRQLSRKRHAQSLQVAKSINAKTLVFHSGYKAMKHKISQDKFKETSIKFWKEFVKEFEDLNIIAAIENVLEPTPSLILDIIENVASPNLKASIDTGHANLVSNLEVSSWIKQYGHHLHHMHIHNNFGDDDSHFSILNGTLDFDKIFDELISTDLKPKIVFEIFDKDDLIESVSYFNTYFGEKQCLEN